MICAGYGWIALLAISTVAGLTENLSRDPEAMEQSTWPVSIALLAMAWPVFFLGRWTRSLEPKLYLHPETADRVSIEQKHRLFWMPMDYAGIAMIAIGMVAMAAEVLD